MDIEKEDGQSEHMICQLKSTDKESISIKQKDLSILECNAAVSHKLPVFAFQFLNKDEVWIAIKESDIEAFKGIIRGNKDQERRLDALSYLSSFFDEEEQSNKEKESVDKEKEYIYNNYSASYKARQKYLKQKKEEKEQYEKELKQKQRERRNKRDWKRS